MKHVAPRLPKIAPTACRRTRIEAWLAFNADVPLRYLCAAAGSGKTTAAILFARSREAHVVYVSLEAQMTPIALYERVAVACGIAVESVKDYATFVRALTQVGRREIIVDDVDRATPSVRAVLERIYIDAPDAVTFIFIARSSETLATAIGDARGLIATIDPTLFAFEPNDIALFAQSLGLNDDPLSIARLWRESHGWATAVAGVCRTAAAHATTLDEAWPSWRRMSRRAIDELVDNAVAQVPSEIATAFARMRVGCDTLDKRMLCTFARHGLFVTDRTGRFELNPLLDRTSNDGNAADAQAPTPAAIDLFGRFEFMIEGRPVPWQRRRDRQIVQFLAMQPTGRATRGDLIACFWPDADRQLAAQSLRTACCTIRRALAARVGYANVGRYFVAEQIVELKLDAVDCTVGRFITHVELGDHAYAAGEAQTAYAHYSAAQRLYRAPFLAGEAPNDWTAPYLARLGVMHGRCVMRLESSLVMLRGSAARLYPLSAEPSPSA